MDRRHEDLERQAIAPCAPLVAKALGLVFGGAHAQREHRLLERGCVGQRAHAGNIQRGDRHDCQWWISSGASSVSASPARTSPATSLTFGLGLALPASSQTLGAITCLGTSIAWECSEVLWPRDRNGAGCAARQDEQAECEQDDPRTRVEDIRRIRVAAETGVDRQRAPPPVGLAADPGPLPPHATQDVELALVERRQQCVGGGCFGTRLAVTFVRVVAAAGLAGAEPGGGSSPSATRSPHNFREASRRPPRGRCAADDLRAVGAFTGESVRWM